LRSRGAWFPTRPAHPSTRPRRSYRPCGPHRSRSEDAIVGAPVPAFHRSESPSLFSASQAMTPSSAYLFQGASA
jgi:hypothetical protein